MQPVGRSAFVQRDATSGSVGSVFGLSGFSVSAGSSFSWTAVYMPGLLLSYLIRNTKHGGRTIQPREINQRKLLIFSLLPFEDHNLFYPDKIWEKYSLFETLETHECCYAGTHQGPHDVKCPGDAVTDVILCPFLQFPATIIKTLSTVVLQALTMSPRVVTKDDSSAGTANRNLRYDAAAPFSNHSALQQTPLYLLLSQRH